MFRSSWVVYLNIYFLITIVEKTSQALYYTSLGSCYVRDSFLNKYLFACVILLYNNYFAGIFLFIFCSFILNV